MARSIQDSSTAVKVTVALPNAANQVNSNVIDLGSTTPYPLTESILVKLTIGAATGANSKNINIAIADSADNSSFTNIAELATWVNANDGSNYAAASRTVQLPPTARRYIRGTAKGEANGGDASDEDLTVQLLF